MHFELKRIKLRALFKLSFIFYAILGCIFGLAFLSFGRLIGFLQNPPALISGVELPEVLRGFFGIFLIIISSLVYGLLGASFMSVGAIIYNVFSSWIGGVRFDLSELEESELEEEE
jgi:hypothetical protein